MSKSKKDKKAKVHKDLEGMELKINDLGDVESNIDIDRLNKFLDENVQDKKITDDVERVSKEEESKKDNKE